MFPWALWLANLGHNTNTILGNGIRRVQLSLEDPDDIVLRLIRADETVVHLFLSQSKLQFR